MGRDDPDRHRTPEGPISTDRATLDGMLLDRVLPTPSERSAALAVDLALVAVGVALMTLASQISIPWHPVPLTGGTFGALLIGGLYGVRRATLTLVAYLGIGAAGLGVFAGWSGGWDYVTGSTGGYLVGYLVCAALVGASWLAPWTPPGADQALGWRSAYELGVEPFVPGDVVKLFFAACLLPGGWALLRVLDRTTGRS